MLFTKPRLKPIMFAGTGSDVGKSIITAGFCRLFKQDGYSPAPFKAQNMANNSFVTQNGLEIGRAQAVQAEAAQAPYHTDMNPLLLKPSSDQVCQVVLNGKPIGQQSAWQYFQKTGREVLEQAVHDAFDRLAAHYHPIVMEGAGSIAEINLKQTDLVNMPMAAYADASVILVADIDKGGVFASAYGSIMLQDEIDRARIKGILINKFRGDIRLLEPGLKMLEDLCHVPVVGVIPYFDDIDIEEEDSVPLQLKRQQAQQGKVNVVVVLLRHMSNFTDFNYLERDPRVHLYYTNNVEEIEKADIVLLPGSKSTLFDLAELRRNGVAQGILNAQRAGASIVGICGGFQMMGMEISDPEHIESDIARMPGLGLLPLTTEMQNHKVTRQTEFTFMTSDGPRCQGYEIHMGRTSTLPGVQAIPLNYLADGQTDGFWADPKCFGSYMHGLLDNPAIVDYLLAPYASQLNQLPVNLQTFKETQYDRLADLLRQHVDMALIYRLLQVD